MGDGRSGTGVPEVAGVRMGWAEAPEWLRREVEKVLGSEIVEAVTQRGGFSPGPAVRVRLADGRRAFVKAVGESLNPDTPGMHRAEARVMEGLPAGLPVPRLLGWVDRDGWVALVFEEIDGVMPQVPWQAGELGRVLATLEELAAALDPAPPLVVPTAEERYGAKFIGWRRLVDAAGADPGALDGVDPWVLRNLERLVELEAGAAGAAGGTALQHVDVRADNLLLTPDGRVVVVDWPWAMVGAPWLDLVLFGQSVWSYEPRGVAARMVAEHPLVADADEARVTAVLAAFTGMVFSRSRDAAPQGLPTVRAWQAAFAGGGVAWLRDRMG